MSRKRRNRQFAAPARNPEDRAPEIRVDQWSSSKFPFDPLFADTPDINAYRDEWVRAEPLYRGGVDRPFAQFAVRRQPERSAPGLAGSPPIIRQQLLLDPQGVQFVMLSRVRAEHWAGAKHVRFHAAVVTPSFLEGEEPQVGGSREQRQSYYDFARPPRLDMQVFIEQRSAGLIRSPWSGAFSVIEGEQFVDLCIGSLPGYPLRPQIAYRIPRAHMRRVEVGKEGLVKAGDVLAKLNELIVYGRADLDEHRHPLVDRVGDYADVVPASRRADLVRLLTQMHREQNDHVPQLNPQGTPAWVNMEDWLPAALVEFPADAVECFASLPGFQVTTWLKQQVLQAIGPSGNFTIAAEHDGEILDVAPVPNQEHLKCVSFACGDEIREQRIPATAVMFSVKAPGKGQPLADVCPRIRFFNYTDLENELGLNSGWVMLEVLKGLFVRPGHAGWDGPGSLIDVRAVPAALLAAAARRENGEISWRLDCRAGAKYLNEAGCLVYPPFPLSGLTVYGKGVRYSFDPLSKRYCGPGAVVAATETAALVGA